MGFAVVDCDHLQLLGFVTRGQQFQRGHFATAWLTPTGPEVQKHGRAFLLGKAPDGAVKTGQLKAGRGALTRPRLELRVCG